MLRTIDDFISLWTHESQSTQKVLDLLTDESLSQSIDAEHRTLGRLAWHVTGTVKEMMERTGLAVDGAPEHAPVPASAKEIAETYARSAKSLAEQIRANWTDATLLESDNMYGETWTRGTTAHVLVLHQAHHRGQMSVLMRQAGLKVPGIYGPAMEEWATFGMETPAI